MTPDPLASKGVFSSAQRDEAQDRRIAEIERRHGETLTVQTDEQREREIERRAQERVAIALDGIPSLLEQAVERGMRKVIEDPAVQERFWARGYAELEKHAGTNAAQWLGRRLWNIIVSAAVAAVLAWAVLTGKTK